MRIVIEVNGEEVTLTGPERVATGSSPAGPADVGERPPGPAPEALLERARKLGALSAGPAQIGVGAALAAKAEPGEALKLPDEPRSTRRRRKSTPRR
jgi:hypothetical protein